jgi:hypothetical protein
VFELFYAIMRVESTVLLISDDWTHASHVGMQQREAFALSDDCTLSMVEECWRSEDAAVLESNDCFESQRDCCDWPGIRCRERGNGSWRCARLPWGADGGGLRRVRLMAIGGHPRRFVAGRASAASM